MKNKLLILSLLFFQITISQTKFLYGSKTGLSEGNSINGDTKTILNQISNISEFEYYDQTLYWINDEGVFYLDNEKVELLTDEANGDEIFMHNNLIYFSRDNEIFSYDLASTTLQTVYQLSNSDSFIKIEFNRENEKIYFLSDLSNNLFNINLDGSNLQVVIPSVSSFALSNTRIYWLPDNEGEFPPFNSSNLFGSETQEIQLGVSFSRGSSISASSSSLGNDFIDFILGDDLVSYSINSDERFIVETREYGTPSFSNLYSVNGKVFYTKGSQIRYDDYQMASSQINEDSFLDFTNTNILVSYGQRIKSYDYEGNYEGIFFDRTGSFGDIENFVYNEDTNTFFFIQNDILYKYEIGSLYIYNIYTIPNDVIVTHLALTETRLYWKEWDKREVNNIFKVKHIDQSTTSTDGSEIITDYSSVDIANNNDFVYYNFDFYGIFDGVFRYNLTTNSEEYIEYDANSYYEKLSITNDKIYVKQSNSIFEMDIDGSNKKLVLNNFVITSWDSRHYTGLFAFNDDVITPPPTPDNNLCETAITLNVGSNFEENAIIATNYNATPSYENSCDAYTANDIWYSVTIPNTGHVFIETKSNSDIVDDTDLMVYEGNCTSLTVIDCGSSLGEDDFSKVIIEGEPGKILYVRAVDNKNSSGSYQLSVYTSISGPIGNTPDNPINLITGGNPEEQQKYISITEYTPSGLSAPENCGISTVEKDVWFETKIPQSGEINIETSFVSNLPGIVAVISVYYGDPSNLIYVGCSESRKITIEGSENDLLLIRVHDYLNENTNGTFGISAYHESVLGTNDYFIKDNAFILYPNPLPIGKSIITITKNNATNGEVSIYNFAGKQVKKLYSNNTKVIEVDVKELSTGAYFMALKDENGTYFKKFIKH